MSEMSKIEWTDYTFNYWEGCTKVSPGCDNCYAEARNNRFSKGANWGPGAPRRLTSQKNRNNPIRWNKTPFFECQSCGFRGTVKDIKKQPDGLCCKTPLLETVRPRVFCQSLADVFDNEAHPAWRADLFRIIHETPYLDWLILTKRIGNAQKMIEQALIDAQLLTSGSTPWPWSNVWLGSTFVDQTEVDRDIIKLLETPAAVHFGSFEPLLGLINLTRVRHDDLDRYRDALNGDINGTYGFYEGVSKLDWVIVGGESGPGARPMKPEWVRYLRTQCICHGTPFLFKQWGEWGLNWQNDENGIKIPGTERMEKMGKHLAGRKLDGETYDQFPKGL